jgi:hypothetical protein
MRGIDGIFPIAGSRDFDFRKGEKLGTKDHIVTTLLRLELLK